MTDPEKAIIQKNKTIRRYRIALWVLLAATSAVSYLLSLPVHVFTIGRFVHSPLGAIVLIWGFPVLTVGTSICALICRKKWLTRIAAALLLLPIVGLVVILISLAAGWLRFG